VIDITTRLLFGEFPREVGTPVRQTIYSEKQFEDFIARHNGKSDCFVSVYPNNLKITEIFFDFDGAGALGDAKQLYTFLTERGYPVIPVASGKKGYHLHVLVKGNGGDKEQLRLVAWSIIYTAFGEKRPTVDEKVVGDLRRLCRIPNTLRPPENLNYCTYLPPNVFVKMTERDVAEHIKSPHHYEYDMVGIPTLSELGEEFGKTAPPFEKRLNRTPSPNEVDIRPIMVKFVPKKIEGLDYYLGLCPFHPDTHPSFAVYRSNWFCWGCRRHGDLIDFIRLWKKEKEV
jgi:hypothetical protein